MRQGFRLLIREPGFAAAAVLTLALGVGANVGVFLVVEAVLLRPLPYPDAGSLVLLKHRDQRTGITKEFIAIGDYVDLASAVSVMAVLARTGAMYGAAVRNRTPDCPYSRRPHRPAAWQSASGSPASVACVSLGTRHS
jgi:hypothetical protein